jgi:hypothetical protein
MGVSIPIIVIELYNFREESQEIIPDVIGRLQSLPPLPAIRAAFEFSSPRIKLTSTMKTKKCGGSQGDAPLGLPPVGGEWGSPPHIFKIKIITPQNLSFRKRYY